MTPLYRLKLRTKEENDDILTDILESAKNIILARRFPYAKTMPDELEPQYIDLQIRCAQDMYNRLGAEGQLSHSENGISRSWGAEWVSSQLLEEIVPMCGVTK